MLIPREKGFSLQTFKVKTPCPNFHDVDSLIACKKKEIIILYVIIC